MHFVDKNLVKSKKLTLKLIVKFKKLAIVNENCLF